LEEIVRKRGGGCEALRCGRKGLYSHSKTGSVSSIERRRGRRGRRRRRRRRGREE
jgi:hypothetical protein